MTGEEMERTMAFILEQQAQASATLTRVTERLDRLAERTDRNAEGITALLAIAEMHEREITTHEREITENREAQARADARNREAQARTDERLNALINTVERYISERRNGKT